nr:unnamed protein product [Digitaria exilis]
MAMNRGSSPSFSAGSCALNTSPQPPRPITASDASPSSFSRNARCSARRISFGVKITVPDRVLYLERQAEEDGQDQPGDEAGDGADDEADDPVADAVPVAAVALAARLGRGRRRRRGRSRRAAVLSTAAGRAALLGEDVPVRRRGTAVVRVAGHHRVAGAARRHGRVRHGVAAVVGIHGGDEDEEHRDEGDEEEEMLPRRGCR